MRTKSGRIFFAIICLFLLLLIGLGMMLQSLVNSQMTKTAFQRLDNNAVVLSQLAAAYYADGTMTTMQFVMNLDLVSRVSGDDAVICNEEGRIVLCSDSPNGCAHQGYTLTKEYRDRILQRGGSRDVSVLLNIYDETRYISARPVYSSSSGDAVGFVIVSCPTSAALENFYRVYDYVLYGSVAVLVVAFLMMLYYSRQQTSPLREMAKTARSFGHGDLDARVRLVGNHPEEIQELALAFNNMASSLQKSEYSRQEFVANVSHELKTPMTTIGGYVDGILDGTIPVEKQQQYMQIVSDETKRLSRLVRSMLDISQLQGEGGIPEEKMTRFDAEECLGQMLLTFEHKILKKDLQVEVDMPDYPVYTLANRDYISQVIYNLLDNAVKFCPVGGVLQVRLREGDSKLYISIANDGETIPPAELSLLFDRFHKIDKSRTRNKDGWGLGLYIVKTIIGLHGEDISVTSMDNRTEFTFTLPLMD